MRRIDMERAKEILRLYYEMGLSQRDVARGTGCSLGVVNAILSRVKEAGIHDPQTLSSKELGSILYPPSGEAVGSKSEPDIERIDREMKKKGVTLMLLWEEYREAHPDGLMYTQFCSRYREYRKKNQVYLRKVYKAGERLLVDWAGLTMQYTEGAVEHKAYIFVATLPASSYLYVEAFRDMTIESWIDAHIHAFEYFGGVPHLLVPDNTKTAVIKARYYDPVLNKTYKEMAGHYGTVIVPARSRRPTDKAPVETAVQIVERRIIAKWRSRQFFSFQEVQQAVHEGLEELNDMPFQKLPGSRRSVFLETEKAELMRLPQRPYEYAQWKKAKVAFDYHVVCDKAHFYSVPYDLVGETVEIRSTSRTIEVFFEGNRVAAHARCYDPRKRYTTEPEHMPKKHQAVADWSPERFISWAAKTGVQTKTFIAALLEQREHPEQAFKTCAGILRLGQSMSPDRMEQLCARALAQNIYTYKMFALLLKEKTDREQDTPIQHENLRGSRYFQEGSDV
ncbi:integrase [Spirochaetia bacterium]|nr:integrase [Spirochaetia bacterium]